ncbi:MAG: hypothetical protein KG029_13795 [Bacteroidetes bacterium]|nr:hypothetical protein [Bacteroidota bacterium]
MAGYRGAARINSVLDAGSVDRQLKKLADFDKLYSEIMGQAVQDAIGIAGARASENAPKLTSELAANIFKKYLGVNKSNMQIRGAVGTNKGQGLKGIVMEVGRNYGARRWKGFFYLYYGVMDKRDEIAALYSKANEQIVQKLVTR